MIGVYYNMDGREASNKTPLNLHKNFYRAIMEAEQATSGKAILVNRHSMWALIEAKFKNKPYRVLVTRK